MTDSNVVELKAPTQDALGDLLKVGARQLLAQAVEAELAELLALHADRQVDGRQAVVRNGYLPGSYRQIWCTAESPALCD